MQYFATLQELILLALTVPGDGSLLCISISNISGLLQWGVYFTCRLSWCQVYYAMTIAIFASLITETSETSMLSDILFQ